MKIKLCIYLIILLSHNCMAKILQPENNTHTVVYGYDISSLPPVDRVELYTHRVAGYDTSDGEKWGRNTLQCFSTQSSDYGRCPTSPQPGHEDPLNITLKFNNSLNNASKTITLVATKNPSTGGNNIITSPLNSSWYGAYGVRFTAWIPMAEVRKLGIGSWNGQLKMGVYQNDRNNTTTNVKKVADWNTFIKINIKDSGKVKIFFPEFRTTSPVVNLNLNSRPGEKSELGGTTRLDMCLYDGNNSASNRIRLKFSDQGYLPADRSPGMFSLYRANADKNLITNRIDYQLRISDPTMGEFRDVKNGIDMIFTGTNSRKFQKLVVIPGIPGASLCVPAPLVFITPKIKLSDKKAGRYRGVVTIIYTPTTES
ncbi:CfaE/CblD family pilus tip adhesin [Erwinia sorbitola]|uniref:CblD family pilus biogenesis initiator protein n=1 Tax=Erwinia sorbitola TaxID=2681984 RepID=A0A6I6EMF3_9GAMM|nr:CfaE/CblD family pilus tip adhesin [Erwinia sorbitola]QGU85792.1 hypothetical protein GN242_00515 [Erwinia sorbitola]